jgi:type II secretory pathway predicted ATPase ExeA
MLTEVMRFYGLARPPIDAGFFETEHQAQVSRDIRAAIVGGRLIALTAVIGSGKTILSRRLRTDLEREACPCGGGGRAIVSRSLSVDKAKITVPLLLAALFYDLTPEKTVRPYRASPSGASAICRSCSGGPRSPWRCSLTMRTTSIPRLSSR